MCKRPVYLKYARENNTFKSIVWSLSGWFILIFDVTGWIHSNIVCWLNQILCILCFVCSVFFLFLPISLLKLKIGLMVVVFLLHFFYLCYPLFGSFCSVYCVRQLKYVSLSLSILFEYLNIWSFHPHPQHI